MTTVTNIERRQAPRFQASHIAHLHFIATILDVRLSAKYLPRTLLGRTLNISETGLMLKIEEPGIDGHYLSSEEYTLRVVIAIPPNSVEIYATPVYFEPLDRSRYLIGARIMKMAESERKRLLEYIRQLTQRQEGPPSDTTRLSD
jgi:hypothetical protein